jgi:large conductance mechanosensitive channel
MVRNFANEFKAFAFKGNLIDLAVAVVIGTAFGKLISSLVANVIMPLLSYATTGMDFSKWKIGEVTIGLFLNDLISFLLIALAVFIVVVKVMGWLMKKKEESVKEQLPLPLTQQEILLKEIRDLLRTKQ